MQSNNTSIFDKYLTLFVALGNVVHESNSRVVGEKPDELFANGVNFFVKSYLVSICTYLEAYLQEIAYFHAKNIDDKVRMAGIPHNYVHWKMGVELKKDRIKFEPLSFSITAKEISDSISGNPYKTIKLFQNLGLDLSGESEFENKKELINTIVSKRNNIVHHNDNAIDISFTDLLSYIEEVVDYISIIDDLVSRQ